jgi:hypothetical protein
MGRSLRRVLLLLLLAPALWLGARGVAQNETAARAAAHTESARPRYNLHLNLDYELLTFTADGAITVPVRNGDSVRDAVFFIYANAPGVSGNDGGHHNVAVDEVTLGAQKLEYSLDSAVLRVKLPTAQSTPFTLSIKWRGVVPRAPAGSGGLMDAMGGMDVGALLGGNLGGTTQPKKDPDYGVYSYGNGVLSLGSFWYPSLAVRQNGKWMDEAPSGVGDVGFSEASDFRVFIKPSEGQAFIVSTGKHDFAANEPVADNAVENPYGHGWFFANNVRDFAVLVSNQFTVKVAPFVPDAEKFKGQGGLEGRRVIWVSTIVTKAHTAKVDKVLDIATHALQIYSKKFGPYPYGEFKVVEGPMRGGAGGMEYSGLVSIASFLFDDMDKQMNQLAAGLGVGDLDKMLANLGLNEDEGAANENANPAQDMLGGMLGQQKAIFDSLLEVTIAHEAAHQWWAMGVGSDAQRAPWQDESLTNYSAMLYFEDRYGKTKAQEMMDLHLKTAYSTGRMLGVADAPVDLATNKYANSMQYGAIVYGKGALYYNALRKLVGDEAFFAALREYYADYNGKLAPENALLEIMKTKAPEKKIAIQNLYARWIESTHGDEDIAGGKVTGVEDLLGGLLGGMAGGLDQ